MDFESNIKKSSTLLLIIVKYTYNLENIVINQLF